MINQPGTLQEELFAEELKELMNKHGVVMEVELTSERLGPAMLIKPLINIRQIREVSYAKPDGPPAEEEKDEDLG